MFNKAKKPKDGLQYWCRKCCSENFQNKKDLYKVTQVAYYEKKCTTEEYKAKARQRGAEWREKNRDRFRKMVSNWKLENKEKCATYERNRRCVRDKIGGLHTQSDIDAIFQKQFGACAYCQDVLNGYHVDHIIPLSRGGHNGASNLALSCPKCNMQKGTKTADEFAEWGLNWARL